MRRLDRYLPIAIGGALGASLRWAVGEAISTTFPWPTLVVNVAGCALLAATTTTASDRRRAFLATGFCGGLTTFSTLSFESATMINDGKSGQMIIYVAASLIFGLGAFIVVRRHRPADDGVAT